MSLQYTFTRQGIRAQSRTLRMEALEDRRLLALTPELAVDVFPGMTPSGSFPGQFLTVDSQAFFWADDGTHGMELWRTDGTSEGTLLLKDIRPGSAGSNERYWTAPMTVLDGVVYFTADDGVHGKEVWRTDGTAEGTYLLKDVTPGIASTFENSSLGFAESAGTNVFFCVGNGKLVVTDGTEAGTRLLRSFGQSWPQEAEVVGDTLMFTVTNGTLWKSDGTDEGTIAVKTVRAHDLTELNGQLMFIGSSTGVNEELWTSDGTAGGTVVVKDATAGDAYSVAAYLTRLGGHVFFSYRRGAHPQTQHMLWKSDGTPEGTEQVATASSWLRTVAAGDDKVYYVIDRGDIDSTEQLWSVTEAGSPRLVNSFYTQDFNFNTNVLPLQEIGGVLYLGFRQSTWSNEFLLWKTDGTSSGTVQVGDAPVTWSSQPSIGALDGALLFSSGRNGDLELWRSEGTTESTQLLREINPGVPQSARLEELTAVGDKLYFMTNVPSRDLWMTAGDGEAAVRLATTAYDSYSTGNYFGSINGLAAANGRLFFTGNREPSYRPNAELFASDGTESGTALVKDIDPRSYYWCDEDGDCDYYPTHFSSNPAGKTDFNGTLFFSASDGLYGRELWKSDGTTVGTVLVKDIHLGTQYYCEPFYPYDCYYDPNDSAPDALIRAGGHLFFTAYEGDHGRELWVTDGTTNGTRLVMDVREGNESAEIAMLGAVRDSLYFVADDGVHGAELWRSEGAEGNTALVADLRAGSASAEITIGAALGEFFYFAVRGAAGGWEVWRAGGQGESAEHVETFPTALGIGAFTAVAGKMAFVVNLPGGAAELWTTDGPSTNSELLFAYSGGISGQPTAVGDQLFFSADDGVHGVELWVSELTNGATYLVQDIHAGEAGSAPSELTLIDRTLYFVADDGLHGRELWKVFVEGAPNAPSHVRNVLTGGHEVRAGQIVEFAIEEVTLVLSQDMQVEGEAGVANVANWKLERNGADISSRIQGVSFAFNDVASRYEARVSFTSPLAFGNLRLTLSDQVEDLAGNDLDGNWDGEAGGDYTIEFTVAAPQPIGNEFRVNTFTSDDQRGFPTSPGQITMDDAGNFVVTWSSVGQEGTGDEIYFQRFSADGAPLGGETRVNATVLGTQRNSTIASTPDGGFVVAWNSDHNAATNFDIYARRFSAAGQPLGDEFLVNTANRDGAQRSPIVATASDGRFAIVWHGPDAEGNGIFAQLFSANGAASGRRFSVNQTAAGQQQIKSATFTGSGQLVVVWQSDGQDGDQGGIYGRVFDASGGPRTGEFLVPQTTAGNQQNPTVAGYDQGFLVTWTSDGQDGDAGAIYARRFNPDGQALVDEFAVNENSAGAQRFSTVALDSDGDALITWSSLGQDGDGYGIYGRRFDAADQSQGHEFRVNTMTQGNQLYSSPVLDDDGDFTIVWSSMGQDGGGYGVYGQRFSVSPPRQAGDADGDGDVDLNDLNAVRNTFGQTGPVVAGDTDDDGDVDLDDLNAVRNNFGATSTLSSEFMAKRNVATRTLVRDESVRASHSNATQPAGTLRSDRVQAAFDHVHAYAAGVWQRYNEALADLEVEAPWRLAIAPHGRRNLRR